jgi:flagellar secretion chaperone FliS
MYQNGIQSYLKTNVYTADPGKLVVMCYEGAIDNLKIAKQKFADEDFEGKCRAIKKALNIIDELLCSLDFEKGGGVARNLQSLYNYMTRRILYADVNQDMAAVDEVVGILGELLEAWREVFSKAEQRMQIESAGSAGGYGRQATISMGF